MAVRTYDLNQCGIAIFPVGGSTEDLKVSGKNSSLPAHEKCIFCKILQIAPVICRVQQGLMCRDVNRFGTNFMRWLQKQNSKQLFFK
jgi:hypothetical protein